MINKVGYFIRRLFVCNWSSFNKNDGYIKKSFNFGAYATDQKIVDLGSYSQVSVWYNYINATTYLKNNTNYPINFSIIYFDGTQKPEAGGIATLGGNTTYNLDYKNTMLNNQACEIANVTLTLSVGDSVYFDYNNVCEYNDIVSKNTILMSIVNSDDACGQKKLG